MCPAPSALNAPISRYTPLAESPWISYTYVPLRLAGEKFPPVWTMVTLPPFPHPTAAKSASTAAPKPEVRDKSWVTLKAHSSLQQVDCVKKRECTDRF